ncbi:outer membrane protein assembly factor BamB family protein, partial [Streptomyces sp. NPDC054841]
LSDGAVAWTFGAGRPAGSYGTPALRGGVVYAAEKDMGVVAVGAADGKLRWETETKRAPEPTVPIAVNGEYVFVTAGGSVCVVNLRTHAQEWAFSRSSRSLTFHESAKRLVLTDGEEVIAVNLTFKYPANPS